MNAASISVLLADDHGVVRAGYYRLLEGTDDIKVIAELHNLGPRTVGHHYTQLKNKLGINDIAGLTRLAIRQGLMTP